MKIKILIVTLLLSLALPVTAQMKLITQGYECSLSDVRLPQSDGGTIAYKPCADCDYKTNRVARDVVWELNGRAMRLEEFRKHLSFVDDRREQIITVHRHLEENRIVRVSIYVRDSE